MCGIAGWIAKENNFFPPPLLEKMTRTIAHRGPDAHGHFYHEYGHGLQVALGHRRLAIIDLAGGLQPMYGPAGEVIVFNGEIYNFRQLAKELRQLGHPATGSGDTEMLLHAYRCWGIDMVRHLRGMFALAIWDPHQEQLFLARDRFGKKPLFIRQQAGSLMFASEIKALLVDENMTQRLSTPALAAYFTYRFVPGPATFYQGIEKLLPGHAALWHQKGWRTWNYYTLPDGQARLPDPSITNPMAHFEQQLTEAVQLRLISDVPLGAFLSGGLDSSVIVALMHRLSGQSVRTFAIGFADTTYSELPYAEQVAKHLTCIHQSILFSANDLVDLLPKATYYRDAPVSEPADLPMYVLSQAAAKEVKVVLTGEGSDEILAGYPKHRVEPWVDLYHRWMPAVIHDHGLQPLIMALPYRFRRLKIAAAALGQRNVKERLARWFGALNAEDQWALTGAAPFWVEQGAQVPHQDALRRILFFDQSVWLPDNLLERGDRMTMAHGLEARNPFMDHGLAEMVASLPNRYRVHGLTSKWILRQVARSWLPKIILERPKVGFRLPVNQWLRHEMRDYLADMLGSGSKTRSLCHAPFLQRLLDEHAAGRQNHEKILWMLLALEVFLRQSQLSL